MNTKGYAPNEGAEGFDGYIDAAEFAKRAGVAYITVWRWIRKRIVVAHKVGRYWVVSLDQLEKVKRYQERAKKARARRYAEWMQQQQQTEGKDQ
ncbi:MAG: hypothetical protein QXD60_02735 [Nanopusillaceae archaeon]